MERLKEEVRSLCEKRRAVILAHNYQSPEVQDVADYAGDSLELAKKAVTVDADVIVFAGVSFMAETVAILNELLLSDNQASSLFRNPSKIMMMKNKFF